MLEIDCVLNICKTAKNPALLPPRQPIDLTSTQAHGCLSLTTHFLILIDWDAAETFVFRTLRQCIDATEFFFHFAFPYRLGRTCILTVDQIRWHIGQKNRERTCITVGSYAETMTLDASLTQQNKYTMYFHLSNIFKTAA